MELAEFFIQASPLGLESFRVDGISLLERTAALQINVDEGDLTRVHVTVKGSGEIHGTGIVNLYHTSSGTLLVQMLDRLNPQEIDTEALSRQGWGEQQSLTEIIIQIIKEKVDEAQSQAHAADPPAADGG